MKSFDELVAIYDNALAEAKSKLPDSLTYKMDRIQVPVMLESSIIERLSDFELLKNTTLNPNILVFEFENHGLNGWILKV